MQTSDKPRRRWGETPWADPQSSIFDRHNTVPAACDVAIVGGGLTGVSTAYHLATRGIRSTIFEADRLGSGASGRTGGLVLEGTAAGTLDEVATCIAELKALVAAERIDCDLALPGCWELDHRVSAPDLMLPWDDGGQPLSIARTVNGGTVQPARLLHGIANAAVSRGAVILQRRAVQRIALDPQPLLVVDHRTIRPGYVVFALNAWTGAMLPDTPRLRSSLTFACATQPLPRATLEALGLDANIPFYTTGGPYLWGRTLADGRVIFGSQLVFGSPAKLEQIDVGTGESAAVLDSLRRRVRGLHPELRSIEFTASWAGPIAFRHDGVPLLARHPLSSRVLVAGAYSGHGVALSVRIGQLLARAIAEDAPLPDWGTFTH